MSNKILYPELSYKITGLCFKVHNTLGRFRKEKEYADMLDSLLKSNNIIYVREYRVPDSGNIVDFLIEDQIVVELKAKRIILRGDYYQAQRYLSVLGKKLALLVNFRNRYLKPIRVINTHSYHSHNL